MKKYPEITTYVPVLIDVTSNKTIFKAPMIRYTIPTVSISAIYHNIFDISTHLYFMERYKSLLG